MDTKIIPKIIKSISILLIIIILVFYKNCINLSSGLLTESHLFSNEVISTRDPLLVSHRGYSKDSPENSLDSLCNAIDMGYWGVEADFMTTKDNQWVVSHDSTIDRLSNGSGVISKLTLEELQRFKFKMPTRKLNTFPTANDFFALCSVNNITLFLEVKSYKSLNELQDLIEKINYYDLNDKVYILSSNRDTLIYFNTHSDLPLQLLARFDSPDTLEFMKNNDVDTLSLNYTAINKDVVRKYASNGLHLAAWTVNNIETYNKMKDLRVSFITSDTISEDDVYD